MDAHALKILEYDTIRQMVAERTLTPEGLKRAADIAPCNTRSRIERWQRLTSENRWIYDQAEEIPLRGIRPLGDAIARTKLHAILHAEELLAISDVIECSRRVRGFIQQRREQLPSLWEMAELLELCPGVMERIRHCINDDGMVTDSASPELARIRSSMKTVINRMNSRMQSYITSSRYQSALQDNIITTRGNRYCLAVKSENRSQVPGIVHDVSGSGATVFIEPQDVVEMGNQHRELQAAEMMEVQRILSELSELAARNYLPIEGNLEFLTDMDIHAAMGRLSADMDAIKPSLSAPGHFLLKNARHPLLKPPVVPISLDLTQRRVLLITGPNTGGKTVTLKTMGLLSLMAMSGMHVPAETAVIPVFDDVLTDIGDEQSIEQSLSTFSAHIKNIARILRSIKENFLVLFDELGAGTDPQEGSALATAVMEELISKQCLAATTTHYGELKIFGMANPHVYCISVAFDEATLKPTYKLLPGAGSSHAITIAAKLGLPESVLSAARKHVAQNADDMSSLMQAVQQKQQQTNMQSQEIEQQLVKQKELNAKLQNAISKLEREKQQAIDEAVSKAVADFDTLVAKADEYYAKLQAQQRENRESQEARKSIREIAQIARKKQRTTDTTNHREELHVGDTVRLNQLGAQGQVLRLKEDSLIVVVGVMEMTLRYNEVSKVVGSKKVVAVKSGIDMGLAKSLKAKSEIHIRQLHIDEAMMELDTYLNDSFMAGMSPVRIIHGKGTGALRSAVHQFLKSHPLVKSYRLADADEGGAGATVAVLKL